MQSFFLWPYWKSYNDILQDINQNWKQGSVALHSGWDITESLANDILQGINQMASDNLGPQYRVIASY